MSARLVPRAAIALAVALALGAWRFSAADAKPRPASPGDTSRADAPAIDVLPAAPPTPRATLALPAVATEPSDDAQMDELRSAARGASPLTIVLARRSLERFPDSPHAPERASILIHALAADGHSSEARGAAEDMVNRYPDSDVVREIERFTGAHRHRNLRLAADGTIESY